MPLKPTGIGYEDDLSVTRAKPVSTPTTKYRDPIRGRQPDSFYSIGGSAQDISGKLAKEANKRRNGSGGR